MPLPSRTAAGLRAGVLTCAGLMLPASVSAQTHLHVLFNNVIAPCSPGAPSCQPGRLMTIDVDRGAVVRNVAARATWGLVSPPAVSADGQFILWTGTDFRFGSVSELAVIDLASGAGGRVMPADPSLVFMDRDHTRVFLSTRRRDLLIVDRQGSREASLNCPASANGAWDLTTMSGDRSRAFVRCPTEPFIGNTFAVDVATGARVATIEDATTWQAANEDGSELFTLDRAPVGSVGGRVRRIDVDSSAVLVERQVGESESNLIGIQYDRRSGRVFVFGGGQLLSLDAATLTEVARLQGPIDHSRVLVALDPDVPHMYIAWARRDPVDVRTIVQQVHTSTLAVLAQGQLPSTLFPEGLVVGPRVTPPTALASIVTDRQVQLNWVPSQDADRRTGFVVEAGSRSGLVDLAAMHVARTDTSLLVTDVPPGTYYVRIRTINGTGPGSVSDEIVVTVH